MARPTQKKEGEPGTLPVPEKVAATPLVTSVRTGEPTPTSIRPPEPQDARLSAAIEPQWKFAEETHQYIREYIRQADQKAAFFFAGATALIAFLYKANLVHTWLKAPANWILTDTLSFVATVSLMVSAAACAGTILPRLQGPRRGIVFFGAISGRQSGDDYADEVRKKTSSELVNAKLSHVHDLARICNTKFSTLRVGLWSGAIGVASAVLLLIFAK